MRDVDDEISDSGPDGAAIGALREGTAEGAVATDVTFAPGIDLHADRALDVTGTWRSPAGRLLELEVEPRGTGDWIGLHVRLPARAEAAWIGFACRSAARAEMMVRPCLRSGTGTGFADRFFARHLLAMPDALNHVDALHLPSEPAIPGEAPWRELVFFLPREAFAWHLHDLRLFAS